jgi:hypothetical protein
MPALALNESFPGPVVRWKVSVCAGCTSASPSPFRSNPVVFAVTLVVASADGHAITSSPPPRSMCTSTSDVPEASAVAPTGRGSVASRVNRSGPEVPTTLTVSTAWAP